jgi:hypothetical protein
VFVTAVDRGRRRAAAPGDSVTRRDADPSRG